MSAFRNFPSPVDFSNDSNWTKIIVHNLNLEENIATQKKPVDCQIFAEIRRSASKARCNSIKIDVVVANIAAAGKYLGQRASKYSQPKQDEVDYHTLPSGKEIMKAWNANDFIFYDEKGHKLHMKSDKDLKKVHAVLVTFRFF